MPDNKPPPPKSPLMPARGTRSELEVPEAAHVPSREQPDAPAGVHIVERKRLPASPEVPSPPAGEVVPEDVPPVRTVKVVFERFRPPSQDELAWVQTPVLGSSARIFRLEDGSRVRFAAHAAAMVLSYSVEPALTTVYVRCRFFPDPGSDWDRKLKSHNKERLKELEAAIVYAFARVKLVPGLVIRFAGGPPMSEEDARLSGYSCWTDQHRAPVRAEFSRDYIRLRELEIRGVYDQMTSHGWFERSVILLWWWCFNRAQLFAYRAGKELANRRFPGTSVVGLGIEPFASGGAQSPKGQLVARSVARLVAPVMQSLVSIVWFGSNSAMRTALLEKGVAVGEERMTRLGTIADEASLYGEDSKVRR